MFNLIVIIYCLWFDKSLSVFVRSLPYSFQYEMTLIKFDQWTDESLLV